MKYNKQNLFYSILFVFFLSSCNMFNSSKMLRTGRNYQYSEFKESIDELEKRYVIAVDDMISFQLHTNDGEKIIDPVGVLKNSIGGGGGGQSANRSEQGSSFLVEYDGTIKLPIFGRFYVEGMTLREIEAVFEKKFAVFYQKPFVNVTVTNKRIFIFKGSAGSVLPLSTTTTLFQALAISGGVGNNKANRIKLIRGDLRTPEVYLIDFSTLKGIKQTNLILQANDIIYLEERDRIPERIVGGLAPYFTLLSTLLVVYSLFQR